MSFSQPQKKPFHSPALSENTDHLVTAICFNLHKEQIGWSEPACKAEVKTQSSDLFFVFRQTLLSYLHATPQWLKNGKIICNYLQPAANFLDKLNRSFEREPADGRSHVRLYNGWCGSADGYGNVNPGELLRISEPIKTKLGNKDY